jgi:hypothetical protein
MINHGGRNFLEKAVQECNDHFEWRTMEHPKIQKSFKSCSLLAEFNLAAKADSKIILDGECTWMSFKVFGSHFMTSDALEKQYILIGCSKYIIRLTYLRTKEELFERRGNTIPDEIPLRGAY